MLILRLSNSQDVAGEIPPGGRAWEIAAKSLADEVGGPVETTQRVIWPRPELPGLIDTWLDRYQPDMVFFWVSYYWGSFEILPNQLERKYGLAGKAAAKVVRLISPINWLRRLPPVEWGRRLARRLIGASANFTVDEIDTIIRDAISRIEARGLPLVVRGPSIPIFPLFTAADLRSAEQRRLEVDARTALICRERGIPYIHEPSVPIEETLRYRFEHDVLHMNPEGQARNGAIDGATMIEAWRARHARRSPTPAGAPAPAEQ